jgi:hypothetical protein
MPESKAGNAAISKCNIKDGKNGTVVWGLKKEKYR